MLHEENPKFIESAKVLAERRAVRWALAGALAMVVAFGVAVAFERTAVREQVPSYVEEVRPNGVFLKTTGKPVLALEKWLVDHPESRILSLCALVPVGGQAGQFLVLPGPALPGAILQSVVYVADKDVPLPDGFSVICAIPRPNGGYLGIVALTP